MRYILLVGLLALIATSAQAQYTDGSWIDCHRGGPCALGNANVTGVTTTTDTSTLNLEGTTTNTLTLKAATTGTATFQGADAAGASNTALDTTGAGTVTLGSADVTAVIATTDGAGINLEGTTANTLTLSVPTTGTSIFQGADAAGASITQLDTTGAGTILVGSADVTGVTLTTDGMVVNVEGTASDTLTLTNAGTGIVTIMGADAAGAASMLIDTTGAGSISVGSVDVLSVPVITDGGTVTIDGYVSAKVPAFALASGALTLNAVHLATATAADYDIPATGCVDAGDVGNWVTVVLEDASMTISITVDDASNVIYVPGLDLGADDELDSVATASNEGSHITLTCLAADQWYATSMSAISGGVIAWADGGGAD